MYFGVFGDDGFDFKDGFDVLNIVNYLFIVLDIYEVIMLNYMVVVVSLVGSFLYGGIGGLMYEVIDLIVENVIG